MEITYDHDKNERNIRERGLDFDRAREFIAAVAKPVYRNGEWRREALGYLDDRLHVLCYKQDENGLRIISFRKANEREAKRSELELRR